MRRMLTVTGGWCRHTKVGAVDGGEPLVEPAESRGGELAVVDPGAVDGRDQRVEHQEPEAPHDELLVEGRVASGPEQLPGERFAHVVVARTDEADLAT